MALKFLRDAKDLNGKRVLARLDFNVPVQDGKVVDDYRIKQSMPTIKFLQDAGAKIIIISHIEGGTDSLKPVFEFLKDQLPISFCEDCLEEGMDRTHAVKSGEILLCENIRLYDGEKKNDEDFSRKLASLGDVYVNDAFSVSHRKHASVVGVPKFLPGYLGFQFEKEIENLSKCFNPPRPFLFILGGAKFDTKLPLVNKFLTIADSVFIGGALANDMFKAKGFNVGMSKISETEFDFSAYLSNEKIMLPVDVTVESTRGREVKAPNQVQSDENMLDAGPQSIEELKKKITEAKCILWNGPLGNYENGFKQPTLDLAKIIADRAAGRPDSESNQAELLTIVGGGDTLAAVAELGLEDKFSFVSTGGGAMLDYLAQETLPGLDALK
jgi:3-phosphoglycerate kinase